MATYRALEDIYPGGNYAYIPAGAIFSDPNSIPVGWVPPGSVDPISTDAIQNFWNAGPQFEFRQWAMRLTTPPSIYWSLINPGTQTYQLTGAGASLGPRQLIPPIPSSGTPAGGIDSQPLGMP